jgi:exonuclease 3'-5' domain-containing protein 2
VHAKKQVVWYTQRNLATWVNENTFQLKFEPKGEGKAHDPYYLQGLKNQCVVCGSTEGLNKNHVVPRVFRVHYPLSYKESTSHDVLPVCGCCHEQYEEFATQLKLELALKYGVIITQQVKRDPILSQISKTLSARRLLVDNTLKLPEARRAQLRILADMPVPAEYQNAPTVRDHGAVVITEVAHRGELFSFIRTWRQHFIDTMKPQYMPEFWDINKNETNL